MTNHDSFIVFVSSMAFCFRFTMLDGKYQLLLHDVWGVYSTQDIIHARFPLVPFSASF